MNEKHRQERKTMSKEKTLQLSKENPFMKHCGIKLIPGENDTICAQIEVTPDHLNPYSLVHGGLLYTMADIAAGATARKYAPTPVTLNSDFHFLQNVSSGVVTARAEVIRAGISTIVLRAQVFSDKGKELAEGTFTYYSSSRRAARNQSSIE
jgi:acyl-CoA thioesterase